MKMLKLFSRASLVINEESEASYHNGNAHDILAKHGYQYVLASSEGTHKERVYHHPGTGQMVHTRNFQALNPKNASFSYTHDVPAASQNRGQSDLNKFKPSKRNTGTTYKELEKHLKRHA